MPFVVESYESNNLGDAQELLWLMLRDSLGQDAVMSGTVHVLWYSKGQERYAVSMLCVDAGYIVNVCTLLENRNRGYCRQLVRHMVASTPQLSVRLPLGHLLLRMFLRMDFVPVASGELLTLSNLPITSRSPPANLLEPPPSVPEENTELSIEQCFFKPALPQPMRLNNPKDL